MRNNPVLLQLACLQSQHYSVQITQTVALSPWFATHIRSVTTDGRSLSRTHLTYTYTCKAAPSPPVSLLSIIAFTWYSAIRFSLHDSMLFGKILFCSWVRTRKHVEWHWCYLCGHFSPVFRKGKESPLDQRMVQMKTTIHVRKSHERLTGEWAKRLSSFCGGRVYHLVSYSRLFNPSGRITALGSTQPLTKMSTRDISWGGGTGA